MRMDLYGCMMQNVVKEAVGKGELGQHGNASGGGQRLFVYSTKELICVFWLVNS
jgi:hypothetical protein